MSFSSNESLFTTETTGDWLDGWDLHITPQPDAHGTGTLTLRLHNSQGKVAFNYVQVTINPVNDEPEPPVLVEPMSEAMEVNLTPILAVDVDDIDGDLLDVTFYNATDDVMINETQLEVAPGSNTSVVWEGLEEGRFYEWYVVVDDGTATVTSETWNFTTNDTTPPTVSITSPGEGDTITSSSLLVQWAGSDAGLGIANYSVRMDSGQWTMVELNQSYEFTGLSNGPHNVWVKARDNSTNAAKTNVSFVVDTLGPELDVLGGFVPTTGDQATLTVNASDPSGVDEVFMYYWTDVSDPLNVSMLSGRGPYHLDIDIPFNATIIYYNISARDGNGLWHSTGQMDEAVVDNDDPIADAGEDIEVPIYTVVELNASGSTDNVGITNYTWNFEFNGSDVVLYGMVVEFNFTQVGIYTVTLLVEDHGINTDFDTVDISVFDPQSGDTEPPVADAGDDITIGVGEKAEFDASGSSDNEGIVDYVWSFDYLGLETRLHNVTANYTFDLVGSYLVTLTVVDGAGLKDTDNLWVYVIDPDSNDTVHPVADAGANITADVNQTVTFNASGSSDDVGIVSYTWSFDDRGEIISLAGMDADYVFKHAGIYKVKLKVMDAAGNQDNDFLWVFVKQPLANDTEDPVADAGPDITVEAGNVVSFDASGSSDNVAVTLYVWSFNYDGIEVELNTGSPDFTFDIVGEYIVSLLVMDAAGNFDEDSLIVTVVLDNTPPQADAGADITADQGDEVEFNGGDSMDNIGVVNWTWTFEYQGNEVTLYGPNPSFTFDETGNYTVTLTVTDDAGFSNTDTMVVTVEEVIDSVDVSFGPVLYEDGSPVVGAEVSMGVYSTVTGADGMIELSGVIPSTYDCTITVGEESETVTVVVNQDGTADVTLPIFSKPDALVNIGPIVDEDGNPIVGAVVTIEINGTEYQGTTDDQGMASVDVPAESLGQEVNVTVTKDGYKDRAYTTTLQDDGTLETQPPEMEETGKEGDQKGGNNTMLFVVLAIIIIAVIAALIMLSRRGKEEEGVVAVEEPAEGEKLMPEEEEELEEGEEPLEEDWAEEDEEFEELAGGETEKDMLEEEEMEEMEPPEFEEEGEPEEAISEEETEELTPEEEAEEELEEGEEPGEEGETEEEEPLPEEEPEEVTPEEEMEGEEVEETAPEEGQELEEMTPEEEMEESEGGQGEGEDGEELEDQWE